MIQRVKKWKETSKNQPESVGILSRGTRVKDLEIALKELSALELQTKLTTDGWEQINTALAPLPVYLFSVASHQ
jgi:hypothetical protein